MWKFIVENWRLIIASTAVILSLISLIFNCSGWKRLRKVARTDKELIGERDEAIERAKKALTYGEIFLVVPKLIKEAEEVFTAPHSGAMKLGYVIQQIQSMFEKNNIKANATELTDYIESILAAPEKKGGA